MFNDVLSVNDVASMASLLEIVVILWRSIRKALDHNEGAKDYAIRKFASVLPEYLKVFKASLLDGFNCSCVILKIGIF